ncbi:hypothetical protein D3C85_1576420 [compost metagenome]
MTGGVHVGVRQQEEEFLAAVARKKIGAPRLLLAEAAELAQYLVAHLVAVQVVDRLEVVQVEERQAQR